HERKLAERDPCRMRASEGLLRARRIPGLEAEDPQIVERARHRLPMLDALAHLELLRDVADACREVTALAREDAEVSGDDRHVPGVALRVRAAQRMLEESACCPEAAHPP